MSFAENLQMLRKQRGMSQENLADAVGVSRQAVSKWELGASLPDMDKLILLSDLFGISIDAFVKDSVSAAESNPTGSSPAGKGGDANSGAPDVLMPPHYGWYPMWYGYEYKSKRTLFGVPLVHVNLGRGLKKAKGIIAIGNIAVGFIAIGGISLGLLSLGGLAAGLLSLGGLALGLLFALGGFSFGTVAVGGIAFGLIALGGIANGMYAIGGISSASQIAVGGVAEGHVAIGKVVKGIYTIRSYTDDITSIPASEVRTLIDKVYPALWPPVRDLLTSLFR